MGSRRWLADQATLQFQATHSWELMIEDQAITTSVGRCVQKTLRRRVTLCLHTGYFEQTPKGTTDLAFVVDDCDPVFHRLSLVWEGYVASAVCVYWTLSYITWTLVLRGVSHFIQSSIRQGSPSPGRDTRRRLSICFTASRDNRWNWNFEARLCLMACRHRWKERNRRYDP